jgi:hypothetical protein
VGCLSRYIVELGTWKPCDFDLAHPPVLPIPFVVLHLAPHIRTLPSYSQGVDVFAFSGDKRSHEREAEMLRGLPTRAIND